MIMRNKRYLITEAELTLPLRKLKTIKRGWSKMMELSMTVVGSADTLDDAKREMQWMGFEDDIQPDYQEEYDIDSWGNGETIGDEMVTIWEYAIYENFGAYKRVYTASMDGLNIDVGQYTWFYRYGRWNATKREIEDYTI